jgi:hypothetical protein
MIELVAHADGRRGAVKLNTFNQAAENDCRLEKKLGGNKCHIVAHELGPPASV